MSLRPRMSAVWCMLPVARNVPCGTGSSCSTAACRRSPSEAAATPMNRRASYGYFLAIPTRWMDNDTYGHVNNVVYYSYFDTAVNEHLIHSGRLDIRDGAAVGVVAETFCRFHKSLSFPDVVDAGLRVAKLGNSSVKYEIALFRQA